MAFHDASGKIRPFLGRNQQTKWRFRPPLYGRHSPQVKGEYFAKLVLDYHYYSRSFVDIGSGYPFPGRSYQYPDRRCVDPCHCLARAARKI
jgi:hypothetical protein